MGKRNKKNRRYKNSYVPDVISFYAKNNKTFDINEVSSEQVHTAAEQIFGTTYYIDFATLTRSDII